MDSAARVAVEGAIGAVPGGAWGVGVSGGSDSVGLLRAMSERAGIRLHVIHLDHELRGEAGRGDARFVAELAERLKLPCTVARRSELESAADSAAGGLPARLRGLRLRLFRDVCARHGLDGVLLGHQRDDQAETVLQRLIRGSNLAGVAGMTGDTVVGGVRIVRPFLSLSRGTLRAWLAEIGQPWREDASNAQPVQQRNRVRKLLEGRPELAERVIALGEVAAAWRTLADGLPDWAEEIDATAAARLPNAIARALAARWLVRRGVPDEEMSPAMIERLLAMIGDAAEADAIQFPGAVRVSRRRGRIIGTSTGASRPGGPFEQPHGGPQVD